MKMDLNNLEIWNILKEGSTNQKDFVSSLTYNEFKEFIELIEDYEEFDLRGYINGGCLFVEDLSEDVEEEYIIYENGRVAITLY